MQTGQKANPVTQPIINTPFQQPGHYWQLDPKTQRATDKLVSGRRPSGDYLPVPRSSPEDGLITTVSNTSEIQPYSQINEIRSHVAQWRNAGWPGVSKATQDLLVYWSGKEVTPQPFFCQLEAVETIIWLRDAARGSSKGKEVRKQLQQLNTEYNESIQRWAIKMATGTGKTRVMQMLIAWLAANHPQSTDVLVITPGLTVKERLQELDPSKNSEIYDGLLPLHLREKVNTARITITNFHAFSRRDKLSVSGTGDNLTGAGRRLLLKGRKGEPESWKESNDEMLNRLLKRHRKRKLFVFNDEAHHCYKPSGREVGRPDSEEKEYEEDAALWFNALRSLQSTKRLEAVVDLSATPMYLRVPANLHTPIFPWTVTDYPLIEAVEAGLTKIPRVPVDDDSDHKSPVYRNVYAHTNPKVIQLANIQSSITSLLEQMHEHYRDEVEPQYQKIGMTPVMIVVANSVKNATELFAHIAGYQDETNNIWVKGAYERFSNVRPDSSGPEENPPSLLVHSGFDRPDELSPGLVNILVKQAQMHAPETSNKKQQLQKIREIFNSVGKKGQPGEHIRCIVSVSMLTEGWDTRTVTHIFGYRKFGTQLLCEQVAGRGLRRTNFEAPDETGILQPEMVNIFGIPFSFMRAEGEFPLPPPLIPYRVYSLPERHASRHIVFPNIVSYRIEEPSHTVVLDPSKVTKYVPEATPIPSMTELIGLTGESHITELTKKRRKQVIYKVAAKVMKYFASDGNRRRQLFSSVVTAVECWLKHPMVNWQDIRRLLVAPHIETVPQEIASCCSKSEGQELQIFPVFADEDDSQQPRCLGTDNIDFETTKRFVRDAERSELNRAPCDSGSEVRVAEVLDTLDGIAAWARNYRLGWQIPYLDQRTGTWRNYVPDFVCRLEKQNSSNEPIYLVIEYKGQPGEDSEIKTSGILDWWIPAVTNSDDPSCLGEWRYVFIQSEEDIRPALIDQINS